QITVQLIDIPPPTTISLNQSFCINTNPTIADIQINEANILFYDSLLLGNILDLSLPLIDGGVYFVANFDSGCVSSIRTMITVELNDEPPIIITGPEDVCVDSA